MDLLTNIIDEKTSGLDLVEVNPLVDSGDITSFLAAKILIEVFTRLLSIIRARDSR
ncbi:MAG: arginase family protein [Thermoprotei archaeon]